MQKSTLAIVIMGVISIIIGVLAQQSERKPEQLPELKSTIILPSPKALSGVQFTTHENKPFTREDLLGVWTILFPGFTNCPDICPTTMQTLKTVKKSMGENNSWGNYQVVMMTVDPKRDTIDKLSKYVPYFDPEFIGIAADEKTTERFAKQIGVLFFARDEDGSENYEVDHSASIILINPKVEWAGAISAPHNSDEIISDLSTLASFYSSDHKASKKSVNFEPINVQSLTSSEKQSGSSAGKEVRIEDAWIRPAPETAKSMAGYFSILNSSADDIRIVAASSPQFDHVGIHNTRFENGMAKMIAVENLLVPSNSKVELAPMALHLMLLGPKTFQSVGSGIQVNLLTDQGQEITQQIKVQQPPGQ